MPKKTPLSRSDSRINILAFLRSSRINWLLALVPISLVLDVFGAPQVWLFVVAALAIIPLAAITSEATEQLSDRIGPGPGGLVNATFGNAPELIIALFALSAGLNEVVRASISGSIIVKVLFSLGTAMVIGGWGREKQVFNQTSIRASAALLFVASVALIMPAVFDLSVFGSLNPTNAPVLELSLLVAFVLMGTYIANLIFSLRTHRELLACIEPIPGVPRLSIGRAVWVLLIATVVTAVEAEMLVGAITEAASALGMTQFFVGVVVLAVIGNAAEHYAAIIMAAKNKMDLAVTLSIGSSTQIALFVAPVLIFASYFVGRPLSLVFNAFETVAVLLSVLALAMVSLDGESNWFEGLELVAVYFVMAIIFYFVPIA